MTIRERTVFRGLPHAVPKKQPRSKKFALCILYRHAALANLPSTREGQRTNKKVRHFLGNNPFFETTSWETVVALSLQNEKKRSSSRRSLNNNNTCTISMMTTNKNEALLNISAMRIKEERANTCHNYLAFCDSNSKVNRSSRKAVMDWSFEVANALELSHETVYVALSFFDRYLSSAKANSQEALDSLPLFDLAAAVSLYLATHLYEPYKSGESIDVFIRMSPRDYNKMDVIGMEQDILSALDRCVDTPTPMDYVHQLLHLLPQEYHVQLLQSCEKHLDKATSDLYYSFFRPSVVGAGILASSLVETNVLSVSERNRFWRQLTQTVDLIGAMEVEKMLLQIKQSTLLLRSPPRRMDDDVINNSSEKKPVRDTQSARQQAEDDVI